jgi:signal transduction histidine kinase
VPSSLSVRGNRSALRQVLLNLLDNAVKFGPVSQTVTVTAEPRDGHTWIVVDDQGPGVPAGDRERVWEGYYRLPREVRNAVAGSGIGLAVVRSLVTEMGGRAWIAESGTGGARFVVELPSGIGTEAG